MIYRILKVSESWVMPLSSISFAAYSLLLRQLSFLTGAPASSLTYKRGPQLGLVILLPSHHRFWLFVLFIYFVEGSTGIWIQGLGFAKETFYCLRHTPSSCFCSLQHSLVLYPRMGWNSLCSSNWPRTHNPPGSASQVLGLQVCATTPGHHHTFFIAW
jgi:hypothetical protein